MPGVGPFWGLPGAGGVRIFVAWLPLDRTEPYVDMRADPRGHYELWEACQRHGSAGLRARGLPDEFLHLEYEAFPCRRVVYDAGRDRVFIYADRCLQRPAIIVGIKAGFGLAAARTNIRSAPTTAPLEHHCGNVKPQVLATRFEAT